jgi:hypothetical protein
MALQTARGKMIENKDDRERVITAIAFLRRHGHSLTEISRLGKYQPGYTDYVLRHHGRCNETFARALAREVANVKESLPADVELPIQPARGRRRKIVAMSFTRPRDETPPVPTEAESAVEETPILLPEQSTSLNDSPALDEQGSTETTVEEEVVSQSPNPFDLVREGRALLMEASGRFEQASALLADEPLFVEPLRAFRDDLLNIMTRVEK